MEFQFFFVLTVLTAFARAYPSNVVAPIAAAPLAVAAKLADAEFDPNPQYSFAYDVHDSLTGDSKSQTESRNGGLVQGQYTVLDPDGTRRIVDYTADPINGFNAVVSKAPLLRAVAAAPLVARTAPLVAAAAAPLVASPAARVVAAPAAPFVAARLAAPAVAAPFAAPYSIARVAFSSPYAVY